jgi:hypothetical protein
LWPSGQLVRSARYIVIEEIDTETGEITRSYREEVNDYRRADGFPRNSLKRRLKHG